MNHIKFIAATLLIGCAFQTSKAQVIEGANLYSPAGGGARILSAQGDTPANPSIGFHASPSTATVAKNDGGGGLGMYRPTSNTLAFSTLSLERMRLSVSGNLGIGTASPTARLHAAADGSVSPFKIERIASGNQNNALSIGFTGSPTNSLSLPAGSTIFSASNPSNLSDILFMTTPQTPALIMKANGNVGIGNTTPGNYKLFVDKSGDIKDGVKFFDSYYNRGIKFGISSEFNSEAYSYSFQAIAGSDETPVPLSINPMGGNIGIGTSDPSAGLHLHKRNLKISGQNSFLSFANDPKSNGDWAIEYYKEADPKSNFNGLNFWRPWTEGFGGGTNFNLFINDNGNVGVNTNNAIATLTVNGTSVIGNPDNFTMPSDYRLYVESGILTEKVKVAVKGSQYWADYVFEPTYKRMSLEKLETFVTTNKHLPNIPSANEMVKEGLDVGNMTSKLLEKIEELTLYIIDQNKKINSLQEQVNKINK